MNGLLSFSLSGIQTCFTITRPSSVNSLNVSMEVRGGYESQSHSQTNPTSPGKEKGLERYHIITEDIG